VETLFENLEAGMSIYEVIEPFPVTREQIDALIAFVARSLDKRPRTDNHHFMRILFDTVRRVAFPVFTPATLLRSVARCWEERANGELIEAPSKSALTLC
jgi:hypothetical protein